MYVSKLRMFNTRHHLLVTFSSKIFSFLISSCTFASEMFCNPHKSLNRSQSHGITKFPIDLALAEWNNDTIFFAELFFHIFVFVHDGRLREDMHTCYSISRHDPKHYFSDAITLRITCTRYSSFVHAQRNLSCMNWRVKKIMKCTEKSR